MHYVVIIKAAHHHADGIGLADVGEKLVAQSLALGRALHQSGDIDELHSRIEYLLRLDDCSQLVESWIRYGHDTNIRINGAERIILRLYTCLGQRVEQGGFSDVGQTNDAT